MGHVLGLDLSLTQTGWPTASPAPGWHDCGTVPTLATWSLGKRLSIIAERVTTMATNAELAVVEQPFAGKGGTTGAAVFGAVVLTLTDRRVPVAIVPPATLKVYACGAGNGGKLGPALSAAKRLGYEGSNDNEVDALWLATLGWHLLGRPVVELPLTHTRALSGKWAKDWPGYIAPGAKVKKGDDVKALGALP